MRPIFFTLRDSIYFIYRDIPEANTLTVGIFAVIIQHERKTISKQTKDALQAKKAKEEKLEMTENLTDVVRLMGVQARQQNVKVSGSRQATALIMSHRD